VEERFKKGNRILHTSYHEDTLTIENIRYTDTLSNFISVQKIFDKKGKLILRIDHTKLTWDADTDVYPNFPLLVRVKARADSVLKYISGKNLPLHICAGIFSAPAILPETHVAPTSGYHGQEKIIHLMSQLCVT
jgi:hypothetical protein